MTDYDAVMDNFNGSEYKKYIDDLKLDSDIAGYF